MIERRFRPFVLYLVPAILASISSASFAQTESLQIKALEGTIELDGDLSDSGWQNAVSVGRWYEIAPADSADAKVANKAWLTYDDRFLYVGFEFADPDPSQIRRPVSDRDIVLTSNDYAGILIDSRNDGKTAQEFLANPRGVQYDGIWSDTAGEDLAPNFYWDAEAKVPATGWNLEMRIPFSTLRYTGDSPTFGVILFRNFPRDFRYEMASVPSPRSADCFVCNAAQLEGLTGLPSGGSYVLAPYVTASRTERARNGLGRPLEANRSADFDGGLDLKWSPNASLAVDLTVNPDFSQVESDVGQISANQRFALFFPETRPFFLEGVDLFTTPFQAVYTRTITEPRLGVRATGRYGNTSFTTLVTQDRGGGLAILPGPTFSDAAPQDFESEVFIGRVRHDLGNSFVSFLLTGREIDGGGSNWVFGPDLEWRPTASDTVRAQYLYSTSDLPVRPDLTEQWDGSSLSDSAFLANWSHETGNEYWILDYRELGGEFRADNGFIPQVGYRDASLDIGYEWRPTGFLSSIRIFGTLEEAEATEGAKQDLLSSQGAGFEFKAKKDSTFGVWFVDEDVFALTRSFERKQARYFFEIAPSASFPQLLIEGAVGDEIDFDNERLGDGAWFALEATARVGDHLEFKLTGDRSWIDVDVAGRSGARLFTADLVRLKATYNFTSQLFLRLIGQRREEDRDPSLYLFDVDERYADFEGSLLLAYKLNWQTVAFIGYGDVREEYRDPITRRRQFEPSTKQFFFKISYAFQR